MFGTNTLEKTDMTKYRFKEKCDICGRWSDEYQSYKGKMIVCCRCMEEKQGLFELDEPEQMNICEMEEDLNGK